MCCGRRSLSREGSVARVVARVARLEGAFLAPCRGKARRERKRSLPDKMDLGVVKPERACEA